MREIIGFVLGVLLLIAIFELFSEQGLCVTLTIDGRPIAHCASIAKGKPAPDMAQSH